MAAVRDGDGDVGCGHGCRVDVTPEAMESTTIRMLAQSVKFKTNFFIIPRERPMGLLDLRIIFSQLQAQNGGASKEVGEEETLPFEAFQRAFERMFYVLQEDSKGFDAKNYDVNGDGFVTWGEFFHVYMKRTITVKLSFCERVYLTFSSPETSTLASIVSVLVLATIILSSFCFIYRTLPQCIVNANSCNVLLRIETGCLLAFVFEYASRVLTVWAVRTEVHDKQKFQELVVGYEPIQLPSAFSRLLKFLFAPANIIDLAAILPGFIGLFVDMEGGAFVVLRLVRLTRIFRAFKSPALVAPVVVIRRTVQQSTKALYVLAFNLLLGIVIFGSLMYMAEGGQAQFGGSRWSDFDKYWERRIGYVWDSAESEWVAMWDKSPYQSIPGSFWWALVTATTVGYGDHYPTTTLGRIIAIATMVFSMVILALPVGVMGGTFSNVWEAYDREKREEGERMAQEMEFITSAIQRLDPTRMSKLLLIEVWHNVAGPPCLSRPPAASFMGEAKFELRLPPDKEVTATCTLRLEENRDIVDRGVSGSVTVKYEWSPAMPEDGPQDATHPGGADFAAPPPKDATLPGVADFAAPPPKGGTAVQQMVADGSKGTKDFELQGSLKVTVLSADKLINLNFCTGLSSPYCMVLCYPTFKPDDFTPHPCLWRSPTAHNTLSPLWDASHLFDFVWCQRKPEGDQVSMLGFRRNKDKSNSRKRSSRASQLDTLTKIDEALSLMRSLSSEVKQQGLDIKQVRDEVQKFSKASGAGAQWLADNLG